MRSIINSLSEYNITEIIYNSGVNSFNKKDLNEWKGKCSSDFLDYYIDNNKKGVERFDNTIECYYNGIDFNNNIESTPFKDKDFGEIQLSRVPLYSTKSNEEIGLVHWVCVINRTKEDRFSHFIYSNKNYIDCNLVYYIDSKYIPENIRNVNENINNDSNYSIARFNFSYLSRPSSLGGTFFTEGDYFSSKGYYSLESGLNKTTAISNIYLPKDTGKQKRSVVLNFPTIDSNNFISQDEYGTTKIKSEVDKILSYVDNEFSSLTPTKNVEIKQDPSKKHILLKPRSGIGFSAPWN